MNFLHAEFVMIHNNFIIRMKMMNINIELIATKYSISNVLIVTTFRSPHNIVKSVKQNLENTIAVNVICMTMIYVKRYFIV